MIHKFVIELIDDYKGFEQDVDFIERIYGAEPIKEHDEEIYNKAIDDVMNKAKEIQEEQIKNLEQHPRRSGKQWAIYMNTHLGHIQIACKRIIEERLNERELE